MQEAQREGFLFVITAPSGAGKTTLIQKLRQEFPYIRFSVSTTTRLPRSGEVNGRDYFFVTQETFREMVKHNAFIEWAHIHGNDYGTTWNFVNEAVSTGAELLLDIDVQGFRALKKHFGDRANYVFIAPPSLETLRQRLEARGTETPEKIHLRVQNARTELQAATEFDFVVINDNLETAYDELRTIYRACHFRPSIRKLTF